MHFYSIICSFIYLIVSVQSQLPIPGKPPGFTYGNGLPAAGVQLETYIDLLCPDSKAAYPSLKQIAEHYQPDDFRLKFVLFPLPYHQHSFATAEAAMTITKALGEENFIKWLETMYINQDLFWNQITSDLSAKQVNKKLYQLAKKTFPSLTEKQWSDQMTGYGGTDADAQTRISWKYTCARGMSGTPMYTLNGVPIDVDATWTYNEWLKIIDPLVEANKPKENTLKSMTTELQKDIPKVSDRRIVRLRTSGNDVLSNEICGFLPMTNTRPCEFVPGHAMCCLKDEACIQGVGCQTLK